jgi:hypothetical protein
MQAPIQCYLALAGGTAGSQALSVVHKNAFSAGLFFRDMPDEGILR